MLHKYALVLSLSIFSVACATTTAPAPINNPAHEVEPADPMAKLTTVDTTVITSTDVEVTPPSEQDVWVSNEIRRGGNFRLVNPNQGYATLCRYNWSCDDEGRCSCSIVTEQ